mmetsp:Transcript_34500/g.64356  ORF Transcript_34500/g.64356 Transcript_34500/m.64356 type:complete len:247 (-) Transcript_34500:223-963(-)
MIADTRDMWSSSLSASRNCSLAFSLSPLGVKWCLPIMTMVGTASASTASSSKEDCMRAPSGLYLCVWNLMPPTKKQPPRTRSRLLRMLPSKLPCTTSTRPSCSAKTAKINSTAFPKVAFRSPPSVSPTEAANSSVALPRTAARGRIAIKFNEKIVGSLHFRCSEAMATGTTSSKMLSGFSKIATFTARQSLTMLYGSRGVISEIGDKIFVLEEPTFEGVVGVLVSKPELEYFGVRLSRPFTTFISL